MAIFIYDLLTILDTGNLVNVTSSNNVMLNNQISARDVNNIANNLTSNNTNTTTPFNDGANIHDPLLIAVLTFAGVGLLFLISIDVAIIYWKITNTAAANNPENIEMDILN